MKTRLLYGFGLGFLLLFFTLQTLPWMLAALLFVHVLAQLEFSSLIPDLDKRVLAMHIASSSLVMLALSLAFTHHVDPAAVLVLLALQVVGYSVLSAVDYERERDHRRFVLLLRSVLFVTLPFACVAAVIATARGLPPYLLLIGASWGADTGAIFAGTLLGRSQLAPRLSPKKTVEGVAGGMLAAGMVFAGACWLYTHYGAAAASQASRELPTAVSMALLFGVGALLSLAGLFGDLTFSLFKREAGIKNYGSVIPGHGGVLDRFDSMLFVAPVLYLLMLIPLL